MGIPAFPTASEFAQEIHLSLDHAAVTTDSSAKMWKNNTGRKVRVRALSYVNGTGLATDATNAFAVRVDNATKVATVATLFNTDTNDDPAGASLAANTWLDGVLSETDDDLILDPGDELDLVFDEDGTATLPAGRLVFAGLIV